MSEPIVEKVFCPNCGNLLRLRYVAGPILKIAPDYWKRYEKIKGVGFRIGNVQYLIVPIEELPETLKVKCECCGHELELIRDSPTPLPSSSASECVKYGKNMIETKLCHIYDCEIELIVNALKYYAKNHPAQREKANNLAVFLLSVKEAKE